MKKLFLLALAACLLIAFSPETKAQSNTIVRFRVSAGPKVLGNIDVELFDQDKPVTVSNFLAYVDSGRYKRTFFHRLIPDFILQGGESRVMNPYSSALFQLVEATPTDPPITNEFNVGTLRPNLFGTLAMAKIPTNAHSATASWFFNLGNNSTNYGTAAENLDLQNGGFTVFGRAIAGTNLFTQLNSRTVNPPRGIMNVYSLDYFFGCGSLAYYNYPPEYPFFEATDLPIALLGNYCVRYVDLLVVDVFRLNSSSTDKVAPLVAIQTPIANAIVQDSDVEVSGTASDLVGVASIDVILNHERLAVLPGGTTWSITLTNVLPGTNTLTVVAIDANGNQSKPAYRNFFHRQQYTLGLTITGQGTVTGLTDEQTVDLYRNYKAVAKPATGHLFSHWQGGFGFGLGGTGDRRDPNLVCYFYPETNAAVEAVFIPNPFIPTKGAYNGLFSEVGTLHNERAGHFSLTLSDRGTYSGKVLVEGRTVPFKGEFALDGTSTATAFRNGSNNLILDLRLDVTNGTGQVTGTVKRLSESWYASMTADRATYNIKTNPAPRAGQYTMIIPGTPGSTTQPQGDGYATVKIDGNGKVTVAGALADGSKFTQTSALSKNDTWPFYASLYTGKGLALGWLDVITGNPSTDILGEVSWLKTLAAGGTYYPGGFLKTNSVVGSQFVKPATATTRIVEIPAGTISFTGGNLASAFSNDIAISPASVATSTSQNKITLTFNKSSGLMSGTVVPPTGGATLKYNGVVLQGPQKGGYGFFLGPTESGRVLLSAPAP